MSEKEVVEEYRRFSGTALDMQRLRRRIEAVERRIGLQETQSGIDGRCLEALQDRVTALDSRVTEIADDVYRRLEIRREDAEGVLDRVAAVENDLFLEIARIANEGDRRAELADRVSALEQELEMPRMWARMQERAEQLYRERMDALESRQQGEAGIDGTRDASPMELEQAHENGRREMAREIAESMRRFNHTDLAAGPIVDGERWADWIERNFASGDRMKENPNG